MDRDRYDQLDRRAFRLWSQICNIRDRGGEYHSLEIERRRLHSMLREASRLMREGVPLIDEVWEDIEERHRV